MLQAPHQGQHCHPFPETAKQVTGLHPMTNVSCGTMAPFWRQGGRATDQKGLLLVVQKSKWKPWPSRGSKDRHTSFYCACLCFFISQCWVVTHLTHSIHFNSSSHWHMRSNQYSGCYLDSFAAAVFLQLVIHPFFRTQVRHR